MTEVRYRALKIGWIRGALGCFAGLLCAGMLGVGGMLLTLDSVAGVLGAVICLVAVVLVVVIVVAGTRLQFIVDDEGLTLLHRFSLRPRRIRWEEVAVIEQSSSYWTSGAVVVVLREPPGQRITAGATADSVAIYRGESIFRFGDPATEPRPPTRAAIDAHRRWLATAGNRTAPQR